MNRTHAHGMNPSPTFLSACLFEQKGFMWRQKILIELLVKTLFMVYFIRFHIVFHPVLSVCDTVCVSVYIGPHVIAPKQAQDGVTVQNV